MRGNTVIRTRMPPLAIIALLGFCIQANAQTPCPEVVRLRNAATEAWKQAMRVSPSERCGALYHASLAAEETLNYATSNRESCHIAIPSLNEFERTHREALQARDNVCAGRPLRPYPPDVIQR
jgi:hypothetical protein